jgi:hypothetical protein
MPPRKTVTMSLPASLLESIERARGDVPRSVFIRRALESVLNTSASSGGGPSSDVIPGESGRGGGVGRRETRERDASSVDRVDPPSAPSRASVEEAEDRAGATDGVSRSPSGPARTIEGQTTVDEMLAYCPNCAGEMQAFVTPPPDEVEAERCEDCGYVREPS